LPCCSLPSLRVDRNKRFSSIRFRCKLRDGPWLQALAAEMSGKEPRASAKSMALLLRAVLAASKVNGSTGRDG
jgi:hypothetical protein